MLFLVQISMQMHSFGVSFYLEFIVPLTIGKLKLKF
jgi:hypothetical protein